MSTGWSFTGSFRVHFNKKEEWPRIWSITAQPTPNVFAWEVTCCSVTVVAGVQLESSDDIDAKPGVDPAAWLSGVAHIDIDAFGHAVIRPIPSR